MTVEAEGIRAALYDAFVAAKLAGTKKVDSAEWGYAFRSNEQAAELATDVALEILGPDRQGWVLDDALEEPAPVDELVALIRDAPCVRSGGACDPSDATLKHAECATSHLRAGDNHQSVLFNLGYQPGPISGGRDHWVSRAHPYDPAIDPPHGLLAQRRR